MWTDAFLFGLVPSSRWVVRNLTCLSIRLCDCLQTDKPSFVLTPSWDGRVQEPHDLGSTVLGLSCTWAVAWSTNSPEQHGHSITFTTSCEPQLAAEGQHHNLRVPCPKKRLCRGPCLRQHHEGGRYLVLLWANITKGPASVSKVKLGACWHCSISRKIACVMTKNLSVCKSYLNALHCSWAAASCCLVTTSRISSGLRMRR